jgi:hypothetical protein
VDSLQVKGGHCRPIHFSVGFSLGAAGINIAWNSVVVEMLELRINLTAKYAQYKLQCIGTNHLILL